MQSPKKDDRLQLERKGGNIMKQSNASIVLSIWILSLLIIGGCAGMQTPSLDAADAYYNRGLAYYAKGQHDQAISDYNKAIEINPRFADAYLNRGGAYYFKREYGKAWEDVHKAQDLGLQVHPEFLEALRKELK